jgi:ATP-dependent 26S proteasome regulatory subunit
MKLTKINTNKNKYIVLPLTILASLAIQPMQAMTTAQKRAQILAGHILPAQSPISLEAAPAAGASDKSNPEVDAFIEECEELLKRTDNDLSYEAVEKFIKQIPASFFKKFSVLYHNSMDDRIAIARGLETFKSQRVVKLIAALYNNHLATYDWHHRVYTIFMNRFARAQQAGRTEDLQLSEKFFTDRGSNISASELLSYAISPTTLDNIGSANIGAENKAVLRETCNYLFWKRAFENYIPQEKIAASPENFKKMIAELHKERLIRDPGFFMKQFTQDQKPRLETTLNALVKKLDQITITEMDKAHSEKHLDIALNMEEMQKIIFHHDNLISLAEQKLDALANSRSASERDALKKKFLYFRTNYSNILKDSQEALKQLEVKKEEQERKALEEKRKAERKAATEEKVILLLDLIEKQGLPKNQFPLDNATLHILRLINDYTNASLEKRALWETCLSTKLSSPPLSKDVFSTRYNQFKYYQDHAEELRKKHEKSMVLKKIKQHIPNGVPSEIVDVINLINNPQDFKQLGAKLPKGILLYGPPGTGKTSIARMIADVSDAGFISASATEFKQQYVGNGAKLLRELFESARKKARSSTSGKCIIFIDEIDVIATNASNAAYVSRSDTETLATLLTEIDGFAKDNSIIFMAATNRKEAIDPALLRSGRLDYHILIGLPDLHGRKAILDSYIQKIVYQGPATVSAELAEKTQGLSCADLEQLVNQAAMLATRAESKEVLPEHLFKALESLHHKTSTSHHSVKQNAAAQSAAQRAQMIINHLKNDALGEPENTLAFAKYLTNLKTATPLAKLKEVDAVLAEFEKRCTPAERAYLQKRFDHHWKINNHVLREHRLNTAIDTADWTEDIPNGVPFEVIDLVEYMRNPEKFNRVGAQLPKGVLLYGPPGTGKTSIARAMAQATDSGFLATSASELRGSLVGQTGKNIRELFAKGRELAKTSSSKKCFLFIDELDLIAKKDGMDSSGANHESRIELQTQLDGFAKDTSLVIIGATNSKDIIHPAILRPGRLDYHILVDLPDAKGRTAILNHYLKKIAFTGSDSYIKQIAEKTEGFSGADLQSLTNKSAILAARLGDTAVTQEHMDKLLQEIKKSKDSEKNVSRKQLSTYEKELSDFELTPRL